MKTLLIHLTLASTAAAVFAGCPQPITVEQADLLPDAAVATTPPRMFCEYEVREVAAAPSGVEGELTAQLVRSREGGLLVRLEAAGDGPATMVVASVARDGSLTEVGRTDETGEPAEVIGLDALWGGGHLMVALTRAAGRIDLLTLDAEGETAAPITSLQGSAEHEAELLWLSGRPLIWTGEQLLGADGEPFELTTLVEASSGDAGVDGGMAGQDAGLDGGVATPRELPEGIVKVVVADETLGWLHRSDEGYSLEHFHRETGEVLSERVLAPGERDIRLIWASDRYVVGDSRGADIARYVVNRGLGRSSPMQIRLGGRMALPRPSPPPRRSSWDNSGPLHVGLAQLVAPRQIRFVNVSLGGQVFDSEALITRERDVARLQVLWDGHGYVLLWAESDTEETHQLQLARFSCPDEG